MRRGARQREDDAGKQTGEIGVYEYVYEYGCDIGPGATYSYTYSYTRISCRQLVTNMRESVINCVALPGRTVTPSASPRIWSGFPGA